MRLALLLIPALLAGCASSAGQIAPAYVPQSTYAAASCDEIATDMVRLRGQLIRLGVIQDQANTHDTQVVYASLGLAWPAIFLMKGNAHSAELARAKGDFDALSAVGVAKGCITATEAGDAKWSYIPPPLPRADGKKP